MTNKDVDDWLLADGRGFTRVSEYQGSQTPTLFQCRHGHQWAARPDGIKRGKGCPTCAGFGQTTESFREWLKIDGRGITLLGEFSKARSKTEFQCLLGHKWDSTPDSIKRGHGCPACSSPGFKNEKPGWVYVLKYANYIKYGITNNLKRRLNDHRKNGPYELYFHQRHEIGSDAAALELLVKRIHGGRYVTKEECPNGHTETLPLHLLEDVIDLLRENSKIETLDTCQGILL